MRRLTPEEAAAQTPVLLRGTVTLAEGGLGLMIVQDATGAVRVEGAPLAGLLITRGRSVELTGVVESGGSNPVVSCGNVRMSGEDGSLPDPIRPTPRDLTSGAFQYRYVEIEGLVRSAIIDHGGRLALAVQAAGRNVQVGVRELFPSDFRPLLDSLVRARGVLVTSFDARGLPVEVKLWVAAFKDLEVVKPARAAAEVPFRTVESILAASSNNSPEHRVRLRGSVSVEAAELVLRDPTGAVRLRPARSETIPAGGPVDVFGFVGHESGAPVLTECTTLNSAREQSSGSPKPVLTTLSLVKSLSEDQARLRYPVHLRAVVTYRNPAANNTFVQDETGGVYVSVGQRTGPEPRYGDLVLVDGFAGPGDFAPIVTVTSLPVIGRRSPPRPAPIEMEQLFTGIADSNWVEARGVVQSIRTVGGLAMLGVSWGGHHFTVYVYAPAGLPESLLDSQVKIQGVCGSLFNFRRQILGLQLYVPDPSFIHVESETSQTPPLRAIEQLLQFSPTSHFNQRSRIQGVVTLAQTGGTIYVSDGTGGVLVQNRAPAPLKVGDSVEVTGLPVAVSGLFNPVLRDAEVHKLGEGRPPEPTLVTAADILNEGYDATLVRIDAEFVDQTAGKALVLQAGNQLFEARLDQERLPVLDKGSLLRVTGIASVQTYESQQILLPRAFSILLRSPADILVLEPAPWLTVARALQALGLACAVALLALIWIVVLRRRVRQQTADLRASRQMLQLVLDHIPQRVFWKDRASRYLGCNKACAVDLGFAVPEGIVGKTDYDLVWRAHADDYVAHDRQVMESGQSEIDYEEAITTANGDHRWVRTSKAPLRDPLGNVIGVLGVFEDITDRKRADQALKQERNLLRALMEGVPDYVYVKDAESRFLLANKGVGELMGVASAEELLGKTDFDYYPKELATQYYLDEQRVVQSGEPLFNREEPCRGPAGESRWNLTTKVPFDDGAGKVIGIVGWGRDITEVRRQAEELRASQQMLRLVLDNIPQWVYWKDRESRYLGCNKSYMGKLGAVTPESIVGKTDHDLEWRASAEAFVATDRQVMESGQAKIGCEAPIVGADGAARWVRTSKAPLYGPSGEVIGVLGVDEDITERKRAEEKLQRYSSQLAETNEELKRFTFIVSHDLRAPLVSVRGFAAELRRSLDALREPMERLLPGLTEPERAGVGQALREDAPEALGFIESSAARMDHLIGALLQLSRVGYREFHIEDLDTGDLLREILRTLAHQIESSKVELKIGPLPRIRSDRTAMEQIFGNLLDNALKYLDPSRTGLIEVSAEETAEGVLFQVRDNGRGIAEDDMDKVFAPFRRAGPQNVPGEGMGLAFVRALLHRLDGRIECQSKLGAGSTFRFALPRMK